MRNWNLRSIRYKPRPSHGIVGTLAGILARRAVGAMGGGGGALFYDAIFLASDELMKKQQGRKAIVVLSDGVSTEAARRFCRRPSSQLSGQVSPGGVEGAGMAVCAGTRRKPARIARRFLSESQRKQPPF